LAGFPIETFMDMEYSQMWKQLPFYEFWQKASILGATKEEVEELYTKSDIPEQFLDGNTKYTPVSTSTAYVRDEHGFHTVDMPAEHDSYILLIAQKFDRYRIPVKFRQTKESFTKYAGSIFHNLTVNQHYSFSAAEQMCDKIIRTNYKFYEITLFPNDEYSKIVLIMVGYNTGCFWMLCDFSPVALGRDIGLSVGLDLNGIMRCIKNYLGI